MAFPSTFVDIQNAVLAKTRMTGTSDTSKVKDWINQAYSRACLDTEYVQDKTTYTLTAGTAEYDLTTISSSIARIKQITVTYSGVLSPPLRRVTLERILRFQESAGGAAVPLAPSQFYALAGYKKLVLYPTPANADTLTVWYVGSPTALSGDSDVSILPEPFSSKLLEYGALAEAADFKGDPAEGEYRQLFEVWIQKLREQMHYRQGGGVEGFEWAYDPAFPPHDPSTDIPWYAGG